MRVLVTGSRNWFTRSRIYSALLAQESATPTPDEKPTLVSGACPTGADYIAEKVAESLGWEVERHPAEWSKYGKSAGYRRNAQMVALGADVCLAFQKDNSNGTQHTIELANAAGIPVKLFTETTKGEGR